MKDLIEKLNGLNNDVNSMIELSEKLIGSVNDVVNEVQKMITTKATAESIEINDPQG